MAKPDILIAISSLSKKTGKLMEQVTKLQKRVEELEKENFELKVAHHEALTTIQDKKKEIEFLSMSHRLADKPETIIEARNKISSLIRTIDNCIRMINED